MRIFAPDRVTGFPQQGVPLLVVDRLSIGMAVGEDLNGNLLEALPAQAGIKLLQSQLRVNPYKLPKVLKRGFLGLRLSAGIIGESLKALCAIALLSYVGRHLSVLGEKCLLARIRSSWIGSDFHGFSV